MLITLNPGIFKAYDIRGVYPDEVNEGAARAVGAALVAYLKSRRIAVGRDMRLSSPAMAAAFIDGATAQGADVVDYGMIPTDTLYFAVARDRHDGGVQITASHNPKQYNGMKLVRAEAFPLSGDAGIGDFVRHSKLQCSLDVGPSNSAPPLGSPDLLHNFRKVFGKQIPAYLQLASHNLGPRDDAHFASGIVPIQRRSVIQGHSQQ